MKKSEDAYKKVFAAAWRKRSIAFKKKWIPFLLDFAQTDLSKESNLISYWKAIAFLSSNPDEEFHLFDEDGFDIAWKRDFKESHYTSIDLGVVQTEVRKVLKYMERRNLPPLSEEGPFHPIILYHANTMLGLYVDHGRFIIKHILTPPLGINENERVGRSVAYLLSKMLNGLPLNSIRKCSGCNHYFVHLSKRKREYCSPTCSSRSIQRDRRGELKNRHPRKHKQFLLEQRFRMGELRKGPRDYATYLRKTNKEDWKSYKRWRERKGRRK